jgi:fatty-acyl-CoA synthase
VSTIQDNGAVGGSSFARKLAVVALVVAFLGPLVWIGGALGTKYGLWNYRIALSALFFPPLGPLPPVLSVSILGGVLGLIALIVLLVRHQRRGLAPALLALIIAAGMGLAFGRLAASLPKSPGIHDVATDWSDPIMFSPNLMKLRVGLNPVEPHPVVPNNPRAGKIAGKSVAEVNAAFCPAAKPLTLAIAPAQALAKARDVATRHHFVIVDEDGGQLETTAVTALYGFKDDVAFRVRPDGAGSRIDMRSISRVGGGDLGANCNRITMLRTDLAG